MLADGIMLKYGMSERGEDMECCVTDRVKENILKLFGHVERMYDDQTENI